jgi:hypothetical protein
MGFTPRNVISNRGAESGCILRGAARSNQGLRLQISQGQAKGSGGPIRGRFQILDVGDNMHSAALEHLLGAATDAEQVVQIIRRGHPGCVSVVNANILVVEE